MSVVSPSNCAVCGDITVLTAASSSPSDESADIQVSFTQFTLQKPSALSAPLENCSVSKAFSSPSIGRVHPRKFGAYMDIMEDPKIARMLRFDTLRAFLGLPELLVFQLNGEHDARQSGIGGECGKQ